MKRRRIAAEELEMMPKPSFLDFEEVEAF